MWYLNSLFQLVACFINHVLILQWKQTQLQQSSTLASDRDPCKCPETHSRPRCPKAAAWSWQPEPEAAHPQSHPAQPCQGLLPHLQDLALLGLRAASSQSCEAGNREKWTTVMGECCSARCWGVSSKGVRCKKQWEQQGCCVSPMPSHLALYTCSPAWKCIPRLENTFLIIPWSSLNCFWIPWGLAFESCSFLRSAEEGERNSRG